MKRPWLANFWWSGMVENTDNTKQLSTSRKLKHRVTHCGQGLARCPLPAASCPLPAARCQLLLQLVEMSEPKARDCPRKITAELNTGKEASEGQNQEGSGGSGGPQQGEEREQTETGCVQQGVEEEEEGEEEELEEEEGETSVKDVVVTEGEVDMEEDEESLKVPHLKRKCTEDSESSQAKKVTNRGGFTKREFYRLKETLCDIRKDINAQSEDDEASLEARVEVQDSAAPGPSSMLCSSGNTTLEKVVGEVKPACSCSRDEQSTGRGQEALPVFKLVSASCIRITSGFIITYPLMPRSHCHGEQGMREDGAGFPTEPTVALSYTAGNTQKPFSQTGFLGTLRHSLTNEHLLSPIIQARIFLEEITVMSSHSVGNKATAGQSRRLNAAECDIRTPFARTGLVDPGRGPPGQRGAQQPCAVRRVSALRAGRFAPLRVDGGESHKLYPPVVARVRGYQHSDATVVWRASYHPPPGTTKLSGLTDTFHWVTHSSAEQSLDQVDVQKEKPEARTRCVSGGPNQAGGRRRKKVPMDGWASSPLALRDLHQSATQATPCAPSFYYSTSPAALLLPPSNQPGGLGTVSNVAFEIKSCPVTTHNS
ncbi:hypothetical protein EYF80_003961 [Liparis tanakae]|uniref:Uncharacterized protein n=1 Tax=Liparis tanakae TaxID=230148 RepID=A0A4Z2J736_9TELE|nr:hypothetical protein EYF80_003961 [Liparis tanakae]